MTANTIAIVFVSLIAAIFAGFVAYGIRLAWLAGKRGGK